MPRILVGMLSRNRPLLLRESVHALYRKPGMKFDLVLWSNGSNDETKQEERDLAKKFGFTLHECRTNIGFRAWRKIFYPSKATHYVWVEDDMIWYEDGWLRKLYEHFSQPINPPTGWKKEFGVVAMVSLIDAVNNGAMWKSHFDHAEETTIQGKQYIISLTACGAPLMVKASVAKKIDAFGPWKGKIPIFGTFDATVNVKYRRANYQVAHARIFCYHANSPFWVSLYRKEFEEKQERPGSFVESIAKYTKDSAMDGRPFVMEGNRWLLDLLKSGGFQEYAKQLFASSAKYHKFIE